MYVEINLPVLWRSIDDDDDDDDDDETTRNDDVEELRGQRNNDEDEERRVQSCLPHLYPVVDRARPTKRRHHQRR
jgi:hypothetical protein